jgi:hypothetical protein
MKEHSGVKKPGACSCVSDPFSSLPPELRPQPKPKKSGLRQVTCPGCGLNYWTNRPTDVCIACEKQGVKAANSPQSKEK